MSLIEHLEELEDDGSFWIDLLSEGLEDGSNIELFFRHAWGEKPYTVEVYKGGEKIGELLENFVGEDD